MDFAIDIQLAKTAGNQLGNLTAKIDDEHDIGMGDVNSDMGCAFASKAGCNQRIANVQLGQGTTSQRMRKCGASGLKQVTLNDGSLKLIHCTGEPFIDHMQIFRPVTKM